MARMSRSRIFWSFIERGETGDGLGRALFWQADLDAVVELERPTALAHQHAGADMRLHLGRAVHELGEGFRLGGGALPHHERKPGETGIIEAVDHRAVGRHDEDFAVVLPKGEGLAFGQRDLEFVGVELANGRAPHQRHRQQALAGRGGVERRQRATRVDAGHLQHFRLVEFDDAGDGHFLDAESQRLGDEIAWVTLQGDEVLVLAAPNRAVEPDSGEEDHEKDETGEARNPDLLALDGAHGARAGPAQLGKQGPRWRKHGRPRPGKGRRSGEPRGMRGHRSKEASSTIHRTNSPNVKPA